MSRGRQRPEELSVTRASPVRTEERPSTGASVGAGRALGIEVGEHQPDVTVGCNQRTGRVEQPEAALDSAVGPADAGEVGGDGLAGAGRPGLWQWRCHGHWSGSGAIVPGASSDGR